MTAPAKHSPVRRLRPHATLADTDCPVVEEPLEIRLNGETLGVLMRTPGHDFELARGFLPSEGLFNGLADMSAPARVPIDCARDEIGLDIPNVIDCCCNSLALEVVAEARRLLVATSSCGTCGRASVERVRSQVPALQDDFKISLNHLSRLPILIRQAQDAFHLTGGVHAAALFTVAGEMVKVCEDIGRHNAVDKVIGWALLQSTLSSSRYGLLVSGRLGFEMAQKALLAGIPMVAALGAASSLAVELAQETGMTLVGFLRGEQAVIYTAPDRVRGQTGSNGRKKCRATALALRAGRDRLVFHTPPGKCVWGDAAVRENCRSLFVLNPA